jgi:predicted PurR-regulated permease PerM
MSLRTFGSTLLGAILGGAIVWYVQTGNIRFTPAGMSFPELAATLLTAVAVIVAIFGGVLALAAVWGFNQLKENAVKAAKEVGLDEIQEQIANGELRDYIVKQIERLINDEIDSDRMERRIRGRVDAVAFGRTDDDQLLEDDE